MKKLILSLLVFMALASFQCRRTQIHQVTFRDTLTFVTNQVKVDTVQHIESIRKDTLVIAKENMVTKVFIHRDSVHVFTHVKPKIETKIVERKVSVPCPEKTHWQNFKDYWWVLVLAVNFGFLLFALVFRKK
ncbi:MAG: hypothetical protein SNJ77_12050 [Cytophagales bacterium]